MLVFDRQHLGGAITLGMHIGAASHWKIMPHPPAPGDNAPFPSVVADNYSPFAEKPSLLACTGFGGGGLWPHKKAEQKGNFREHVVNALVENGFPQCNMGYQSAMEWVASASKSAFVVSPAGAGFSCHRT
jgi:hypothetical protein